MRAGATLGSVAAACLAAGCQAAVGGEVDVEVDPGQAEAEGFFPGPPRWSVRMARTTTRPLGVLARWRPPGAAQVAGLGVVVGLRRTGDHGDAWEELLGFWAQQRAAGAYRDLPVPTRVGTAALVAVEALLPADAPPGAAEVRPLGNATSLEGGRLLATGLSVGTETMADAEGPLILSRVGADGTVVRDARRGRVATVTPRRPPDARRVELEVVSALPGAPDAVAGLLQEALAGAQVAIDAGPPPRVVATLPAPVSADAVAALLARPCPVTVAEPGAVVFAGDDTIELLGPPPALGLVNLRIPRPGPGRPDAFLRLVGVPAWQGRSIRRALVEFDVPDRGRVRVVCGNQLAELLPVLDRVGLSSREVAMYLAQARTAGALAAVVVTEWGPGPADKARVPDGR